MKAFVVTTIRIYFLLFLFPLPLVQRTEHTEKECVNDKAPTFPGLYFMFWHNFNFLPGDMTKKDIYLDWIRGNVKMNHAAKLAC